MLFCSRSKEMAASFGGDEDGVYDGTYITGIRITGTFGGGSTLQLQITTCNAHNDFETTRQGYMTANQYKKLAVFIIAQSGSTDLLGDPIMDHIYHRMYNRSSLDAQWR
jgi:hypothetical protein